MIRFLNRPLRIALLIVFLILLAGTISIYYHQNYLTFASNQQLTSRIEEILTSNRRDYEVINEVDQNIAELVARNYFIGKRYQVRKDILVKENGMLNGRLYLEWESFKEFGEVYWYSYVDIEPDAFIYLWCPEIRHVAWESKLKEQGIFINTSNANNFKLASFY